MGRGAVRPRASADRCGRSDGRPARLRDQPGLSALVSGDERLADAGLHRDPVDRGRRGLGAARPRPARARPLAARAGRAAEAERRLQVEQAREAERAGSPARCTTCSPTASRCWPARGRARVPPRRAAGGDRRGGRRHPRQRARRPAGAARGDRRAARRRRGTTPPAPPQPTLADIPALVDESRAAGMRVRCSIDEAAAAARAARAVGRTAYRVVQEGLTNARKHAPGAAVEVTVARGDEHGLVVRSSPPAGRRRRGRAPARARGRRRARRAWPSASRWPAASCAHGPTADGGFVLRATCPGGRRERADPRPARRRRRARARRPAHDARRRRATSRSSARPTTAAAWSARSTAPPRRRPHGHPHAAPRRPRGDRLLRGPPRPAGRGRADDVRRRRARRPRAAGGRRGFLLKDTPPDEIVRPSSSSPPATRCCPPPSRGGSSTRGGDARRAARRGAPPAPGSRG